MQFSICDTQRRTLAPSRPTNFEKGRVIVYWKYEDFAKRYEEMTSSIVCTCEAAEPIVGGVTSDEKGVRAFIEHHLKITDPVEAEATYQRILSEEMGNHDLAPPLGELEERLTYGINVIRKTEVGPYLGNWMIHANIKTAMSRLLLYSEKQGTKGNTTEAGVVRPYGISRLDDNPRCVYLVDKEGRPAETYFEEFKGRVNSPKGATSIMHHSECVPPGTRFEFEFRFLTGKLTDNDVYDFLSVAMIVGIGSVKSLGHGKFRIIECSYESAVKPRIKEEKRDKEPKGKKKKGASGQEVEPAAVSTSGAEQNADLIAR